MNNVAVIPYIGMHALQIQNVKRNTVKKVSINVLNNDPNVSEYKKEDLVPTNGLEPIINEEGLVSEPIENDNNNNVGTEI
jgi:hypothetical protein